jgi:ferritin-like metal-binding protein YciE
MNDLDKLFVGELRAIYDGEQHFVQALGDMAEQAMSPDVKRALAEGSNQAKSHVERVQEVFDALSQSPKAKTCHGIRGIITEGQLLAGELEGDSAIDAGLISTAEKGAHFRIASFGTVWTWAGELGHHRAGELLKRNLDEAKEACAKLVRLSRAAQRIEMKGRHELERLFVRQLRQMLDGEHLLVPALAEVEFYAVSRLLKLAVHYHLAQTRKHAKRLEEVFTDLGETPDRRPCDGIEGIIDDAQVAVMEFLGNSALDAALISSAQKAERYEISAYDNLCRWATQLGRQKAFGLLQENLNEEVATDKKLTLAAEMLRNRTARRHESARRSQETAEFLKVATHGE